MPQTAFASVDRYLAAQPEKNLEALTQLRATLRKALPKATELISYQMPAYRVPEGMVLYFAGWSTHVSVYPVGTRVAEVLGDAIAPYRVSKGTLRFALSEPLPLKLIAKVAKLRLEETLERAAMKRSTKTKAPAKKRPARALTRRR